ncbi:MAG: phosphodiester glycosidase family protein [Deltaproteobacteria bacterium]|nr:phosphodiester glycosidase family protein [Deltaproteobacteria bacterium]
MLYRFLLALLLVVLSAPGAAEELRNSDYTWKTIGKGLSFTRLEVLDRREIVESLAVVRIDPDFNSFRVYHGAPRRISDWWQVTNAPVIFNGSYFTRAWQPCGLVIIDDKTYGPLHNAAMRGMFVAEPRGVSPDLPRATILDLTARPINVKNLPWTQGLMSFPLLLDSRGRIRVKQTELMAQRTIICTDRQGNILVIHSAGDFFSLYELAGFLKNSSLDIDLALNLDGGSKAQLLINTPDFSFASPSYLEQSARAFFDAEALLLPTIIGVFPRQE